MQWCKPEGSKRKSSKGEQKGLPPKHFLIPAKTLQRPPPCWFRGGWKKHCSVVVILDSVAVFIVLWQTESCTCSKTVFSCDTWGIFMAFKPCASSSRYLCSQDLPPCRLLAEEVAAVILKSMVTSSEAVSVSETPVPQHCSEAKPKAQCCHGWSVILVPCVEGILWSLQTSELGICLKAAKAMFLKIHVLLEVGTITPVDRSDFFCCFKAKLLLLQVHSSNVCAYAVYDPDFS